MEPCLINFQGGSRIVFGYQCVRFSPRPIFRNSQFRCFLWMAFNRCYSVHELPHLLDLHARACVHSIRPSPVTELPGLQTSGMQGGHRGSRDEIDFCRYSSMSERKSCQRDSKGELPSVLIWADICGQAFVLQTNPLR